MKMTLKEVNERYSALASTGSLTLPIKLSYAITCNLDALRKHVDYTEKARKELCERYCKRDADGNVVMIDSFSGGQKVSNYDMEPEKEKLFKTEYEDLINTEEADVNIRKVKLSVLEECSTQERYDIPNVAQQLAMHFMISEE